VSTRASPNCRQPSGWLPGGVDATWAAQVAAAGWTCEGWRRPSRPASLRPRRRPGAPPRLSVMMDHICLTYLVADVRPRPQTRRPERDTHGPRDVEYERRACGGEPVIHEHHARPLRAIDAGRQRIMSSVVNPWATRSRQCVVRVADSGWRVRSGGSPADDQRTAVMRWNSQDHMPPLWVVTTAAFNFTSPVVDKVVKSNVGECR
jgi:hypothetical protein